VPLFQEQVMQIAVDLGGFTPGQADQLRRAIGAWRANGKFEEMTEPLRRGLINAGLSKDYTDRILKQIAGFAEYGFPESHAASFALLAYASAYLKRHYHAEFTCALLNSLPMGFYAAHTLIDDAKLHDVTVLPVDIEESSWECCLSQGSLRLGWNMVKGLRQSDAELVIAARPFASLADVLQRAPFRRDVLLRLAMGGTFARYGLEPRAALWEVLEFHRRKQKGQGDLFLDTNYQPAPSQTSFASLDDLGVIQQQYSAFSLSTHGHPMMAMRKMARVPSLNTQSAKKLPNGVHLSVAGLILVRQKPPTAKNMTFSTLEDEFGFLDLAIGPQVYERVKEAFLNHCFLEVRGRMQKDAKSFSVWVLDLRPLSSECEGLVIEPTQYFH
jgi:error-prone DNA polymerase